MMVDNLPVLYRNVLMGFETHQAQAAFLWAADGRDASRMKYEAERYAQEVDRLVTFLRPHLALAAGQHEAPEGVIDDVVRFILDRHANRLWGGNLKFAHHIEGKAE